MNTEKRRYPRFCVDLPIEYTRRDFVVKQDRVRNISEGGLLAYFSEQMEVGQYLRMKLFLPSISGLEFIGVVNQIVWTDIEEDKREDYRTGVKFADISPENLKKLKYYLDGLS